MSRLQILFISLGILGSCGTLSAQYVLPMNFTGSDSTSIRQNLRLFSRHIGVHFGDSPGTVFQQGHEYPRVTLFYQHDAAYTVSPKRYWSGGEDAMTMAGTFSVVGNVTPNLQLLLRYNAMILNGNASEFTGYGARYRSGIGTDSLHSVALGVLMQKLNNAGVSPVNTLDFTLQYSRYLLKWTLVGDFTISYVSGTLNNLDTEQFGGTFNGEFEDRVIHGGIGVIRQWRSLTFEAKLRSDLQIWNVILTIGWSFPSGN